MRLKDFLMFQWVALLWTLEKAGATTKGLKITGLVIAIAGLSFWAGTLI